MRKVFIAVIVVVAVALFALDLRQFSIKDFKGEYPLVSLKRFLETEEFVSVEGVVYNVKADKKFLTVEEASTLNLSEDRLVGILAIDIDELSSFDGKNKPALVAVNGIIYDVSNSNLWRGGVHRGRHSAGEELTYDIVKDSPHGIRKLQGFRTYGVLVFTLEQLSKFAQDTKAKPYVAFSGVVYDVKDSPAYNGRNRTFHSFPVGQELTYELSRVENVQASLSKSFPVGLLIFDAQTLSRFDGTQVRVFNEETYKSFIMVAGIVYDVTNVPDWRAELKLEDDAQAGKDYTGQFECELEGSCEHEHADPMVLREFLRVGFGTL